MKTAFSNLVFGLLTFSLTLPPQVFAQSDANVASSPELAHLRHSLGKAMTQMNVQGAKFSLSPDFSSNSQLSQESVQRVFDSHGAKDIYELIQDKSSGAQIGLHLNVNFASHEPSVRAEMMNVDNNHLIAFETPIATEIPIDLNHGDAFKSKLNEAAQTLSAKAIAQLNNPFAKASERHTLKKLFASMTEMLVPSAHALDLGMLIIPLIIGGMTVTIIFAVGSMMASDVGLASGNAEVATRAASRKKIAIYVFGGMIGVIVLDQIISWVTSPNR